MPPMWFLLLLAFCAGWSGHLTLTIFKGGDVHIAGQKVQRFTVALAITIILVAAGLLIAIFLGFVPDHAP